MQNNKLPYNTERRNFDPEILNFTLRSIQKSIDDHSRATTSKFNELQASILVLQKDNRYKNEHINQVDKDFHVCRATNSVKAKTEDITNGKRNALLFQILTTITAVGALFLGACSYFKKGG